MNTTLKTLSIAAVLAASLGLAGCAATPGSGNSMPMDHGSPGTMSGSMPAAPLASTEADHNQADVTFAQMMIPHHQQAIDMAKMAAEKATGQQVKDLATRIEGAQDPEIQQMTAMLDAWGASPTASSMPGMDHDSGHGSGDGMMTDDEMGQLGRASGAEFDRMWLQMMIRHHQGAVTMAQTEVDSGVNTEAKALAQRIIDAQRAEITEMRGMVS
jgi:uncharacterized protein (DUF305 family)